MVSLVDTMPKKQNALIESIKNKGVDQLFYPGISIDVDLDGGLEQEILAIAKTLEQSGYIGNSSNIFKIMQIKRLLLQKYQREGGKTAVNDYQAILKEVKPIGTFIPVEFILVNGITILLLYCIGTFVKSFSEESGKIAAKKLFDNPKKYSKKVNTTPSEYKIFVRELNIIINEKQILELSSNLRKNKKNHSHKGKTKPKGGN